MSRNCGCPDHEENSSGESFVLVDLRHKTVSKQTVAALLGDRRVNFLCTACIKNHEDKFPPPKRLKKATECEKIVTLLKSGVLDYEELSLIAKTLGESIAKDISSDIDEVSSCYKDHASLTSFDVKSWLNSRNPVLVSFLKGTSIKTSNTELEKERCMCLASAVDSIYKASRLRLITPLHFMTNLVSYHVSGSKLLCSMDNQLAPAGSYQSVLKWLNEQSIAPLSHPPATDTVTYFDNNQVLVKNWRVRFDARMAVSVITTVMHLFPPHPSRLQFDPALIPSSWLYSPNLDLQMLSDKIHALLLHADTTFQRLRNSFLQRRILEVYHQQTQTPEGIHDMVDEDAAPVKTDELGSLYVTVPHHHADQPTKTTMGDPIFVNPCSYASVEKVLRSIQTTCSDNNRKWTVAGCDGLPYALGSRIIERTDDLRNVVMTPGLGHFEINMTRACFKLLWVPVIEELAKLLNYSSDKALKCCKNAYNHHKSFQILTILFFGTCDELIVPYVRHAMSTGQQPSLTAFYAYMSENKNPNYIFP